MLSLLFRQLFVNITSVVILNIIIITFNERFQNMSLIVTNLLSKTAFIVDISVCCYAAVTLLPQALNNVFVHSIIYQKKKKNKNQQASLC